MFLIDDAGYGDIFNSPLLTPNFDQFGRDGMSFTEAYAGSPVCAPSRCTLMTGRHSGHCTVRSNGPILGADDTTVATVLKKAGYDTALIGCACGVGVRLVGFVARNIHLVLADVAARLVARSCSTRSSCRMRRATGFFTTLLPWLCAAVAPRCVPASGALETSGQRATR
jgi:hypothetical protein